MTTSCHVEIDEREKSQPSGSPESSKPERQAGEQDTEETQDAPEREGPQTEVVGGIPQFRKTGGHTIQDGYDERRNSTDETRELSRKPRRRNKAPSELRWHCSWHLTNPELSGAPHQP
jgi:hypothetical protein